MPLPWENDVSILKRQVAPVTVKPAIHHVHSASLLAVTLLLSHYPSSQIDLPEKVKQTQKIGRIPSLIGSLTPAHDRSIVL